MTLTLRFPCPLCGQDMETLTTLQGMSWFCPACNITFNGATCNHCQLKLTYDGYNPTHYFFSCPTCPVKVKVAKSQMRDWLFQSRTVNQQLKDSLN